MAGEAFSLSRSHTHTSCRAFPVRMARTNKGPFTPQTSIYSNKSVACPGAFGTFRSLSEHWASKSLGRALFETTSSSKRLRRGLDAAPGPSRSQLGADLGPTWGQLGAYLGLRRGSFSLKGKNNTICTAPAREHDFRLPGGSKTGSISVRNSIFEVSSAQKAISKPL